jgi:hypothetical protein
MTAQVNIVLAEANNAFTIPTAALRVRGRDGSYAGMVFDADGK